MSELVIRELQDKEEIRELLQHYCFLLDTMQMDRIPPEVYTGDAEDIHGYEEDYIANGHDELLALFKRVPENFAATAHLITNYHVEVRGDEAHSRVYVLAFHWMEHGESSGDGRPAESVLLCTYDDDLVRTEDGWRIRRRRLHAFGPGSSLAIGWLPAALAPSQGINLYSPGDS
jgi:SnoaL-like domain